MSFIRILLPQHIISGFPISIGDEAILSPITFTTHIHPQHLAVKPTSPAGKDLTIKRVGDEIYFWAKSQSEGSSKRRGRRPRKADAATR